MHFIFSINLSKVFLSVILLTNSLLLGLKFPLRASSTYLIESSIVLFCLEAFLSVKLEDKADMYFKGSDEPCAMFEIAIFGSAEKSAYEDLTKRICSLSEKYLSVKSERTYVKYNEIDKWGYDNFNF